MTVWCHLPTILKRRRALRIAGLLTLCVAIITSLLFANVSHALPNITKTTSFQGRLLSASGAVVPDGYYNIEFKIYQDGTGTSAGNPDGTLKWTETYVNNGGTSGVKVRNGYFSVDLGSKTPFGTNIDWNQSTLWLSMNVAGSSQSCTTFGTAPCTADGEMLPMKKIGAVPHAINSSLLGGIDAAGFIQNSTTPQTADFSISGTGTATTLQGNTSVIAPLFDRSTTGTLSIGTVNASTIEIASNNIDHTINIGTGTANQTVTIGSETGTSGLTLQGGSGGVRIETNQGAFVVHNNTNGVNVDSLAIDLVGNTSVNLFDGSRFAINNQAGNYVFRVGDDGSIVTNHDSALQVNGTATFERGLTIQGSGSVTYTTPGGANLHTAINIPNFSVPNYGTVMAFGLPSTSAATARGLLVADGRTEAHQATIGVLSPNEEAILGLSWNGSNSTGYLANTANSLALQGNGLNLLTATNVGGQANVGIGNNASAGYALDVTGDTNTSTQYRINGATALTGSALTFSGNVTSTITSATDQSLALNGTAGLTIQTGGETRATFSDDNIKIGDNTGTPTLLTLDSATTAPTEDEELLGSMYYDSTLGKVQCLEEEGWGNCGSAPDNFVTLSPEYANAVMNGNDIGTISSDLCSDALNINDGSSAQPTVCGTNETYNFYQWTTSETDTQTRSIYVTYQLPSTFKNFIAGSTSLMGRTDSANSSVTYQIYRDNPTNGLTPCGSAISVSTGAQSTWQKATASATDPSTCSFEPGDSIFFRINLSAEDDANAYVSNLNFTFSNN